MKRLTFAISALIVLGLAVAAVAGKTQIAATYYRMIGSSPFYGRSDGIVVGTRMKEIKVVNNGQLSGDLGKSVYLDFTGYSDGDSISCRDQAGWGACDGNASLAPCICEDESGGRFGWIPINQQDLPPDMDAGSLDIGGDQADNDGAYLVWGMPGLSGRPFYIGIDPAFYMCTTAAFADATGIDQNIMAGFAGIPSGAAAVDDGFPADFEDLDHYAGIGVLGTAAGGVTGEDVTIKTETDAAQDGTGDGVTTTDTTDTAEEATTYRYCTYVSAAGVVTYTFNGSAPTTTAAFTFVDGIPVVPFLAYLHTNDVAGEVDLYRVEIGFQE